MSTSDFPTLKEQEEYWEGWQETRSISAWSLRRAEAIEAILRSLNLDRPAILDFGCGNGWFTERLSNFGQATGIDLSQKAMARARALFPHATFLAGDLFEATLPAAYFDVVISQQVIAHVVDQAGYLDRAANLLKAGGYLILSTPNKFVIDRLDLPPEPLGHIESWLRMRDLKRALRPRFDVLRTLTVLPMGHLGILRLINSYRINALIGRLIPQKRIDALKEWAGLGYTMIVLARKR